MDDQYQSRPRATHWQAGPRGCRIATYNVNEMVWFCLMITTGCTADEWLVQRWENYAAADQTAALCTVFNVLGSDAIMVIERARNGSKHSAVKAFGEFWLPMSGYAARARADAFGQ